MTNMQELADAIVETEAWVDDLVKRLAWRDRSRALAALLGVLHALRDNLPRDRVVYLGAQLPPLLRGLYYEAWHPAARISARNRKAFLDRIHEAMHRDPGVDAEQAAHAVFSLLAARMPPGEVEGTKAATPGPLRSFWPD